MVANGPKLSVQWSHKYRKMNVMNSLRGMPCSCSLLICSCCADCSL